MWAGANGRLAGARTRLSHIGYIDLGLDELGFGIVGQVERQTLHVDVGDRINGGCDVLVDIS